jgi:hypothetical protein
LSYASPLSYFRSYDTQALEFSFIHTSNRKFHKPTSEGL